MSGRKSYTRQEEQRLAGHVAIWRVMRLAQIILLAGGLAGWICQSFHWLFWGAVAAWIMGKAVPPNDELDRLSER